ncbi:MAG: hypothetical protein ACRD3J_21450 [Thermoanaerobaculia bacterium]
MTQVKPEIIVVCLVAVMAVYKIVELCTAKFKIDQTVFRADRMLTGFGDLPTAQSVTIANDVPNREVVERYLRLLKRLEIEFGLYSMILILVLFAVLGFSLMLFRDVKENWWTSIVIGACTMVMSLFGAIVNYGVELIRLRLDENA